jgi:hypothetical protein
LSIDLTSNPDKAKAADEIGVRAGPIGVRPRNPKSLLARRLFGDFTSTSPGRRQTFSTRERQRWNYGQANSSKAASCPRPGQYARAAGRARARIYSWGDRPAWRRLPRKVISRNQSRTLESPQVRPQHANYRERLPGVHRKRALALNSFNVSQPRARILGAGQRLVALRASVYSTSRGASHASGTARPTAASRGIHRDPDQPILARCPAGHPPERWRSIFVTAFFSAWRLNL